MALFYPAERNQLKKKSVPWFVLSALLSLLHYIWQLGNVLYAKNIFVSGETRNLKLKY